MLLRWSRAVKLQRITTITFALVVLIVSTALAQSVDLAVPYEQQQANDWCWAASVQMMLEYLHHPVSQCAIVEQGYWKYPMTCCPGPPVNYFCSNWLGSTSQVQAVVYNNSGFTSVLTTQLSPALLFQELQLGKPVIAHVNLWARANAGHFAVIRGMTYYNTIPYVIINDPLFGYRQVDWSSFSPTWDYSVVPW